MHRTANYSWLARTEILVSDWLCWATEEHCARIKAEGEAEDYSRRLTVAQEQIAEYAQERHLEIAQLLEQAEQLGAVLQQLGTAGSSGQDHLGSAGQQAEVQPSFGHHELHTSLPALLLMTAR